MTTLPQTAGDSQSDSIESRPLRDVAPRANQHTAGSSMAAAWMLAVREWVRFFRQRNRVIGALGQPILFWLLFGTGMHAAFSSPGQDYMTYYLPGTITLIILFTAIFATISIIEDRKEGFLQNVLIAPVPRWTIVAGKVFGGSAIAWCQALLFLGLALLVGSLQWRWELVPMLVLMAVAAFATTALGVFFAWPMDSTQGFHAIMNLVLLPLWLLSGAFFPIPQLGGGEPVGQVVLHWVMRCNPMSYVIAGIRQLLGTRPEAVEYWMPSLASCWSIALVFLCVTCLAAWWVVTAPAKGNLR